MRTERKILTAFSILSAIFGCAGLTATNEADYLLIMLLGFFGVAITNLKHFEL